MFLKEEEMVKVILTKNTQITKWRNQTGIDIIENKPFEIYWTFLKSKAEQRKLFIKVKCDDCNLLFERRIRDLDENNNIHYCKKCIHKGERGPAYGKPINQGLKNAVKKMNDEGNNPFSRPEVKEKIKNKQKEITAKVVSKNTGKKRTEEAKLNISQALVNSYKTGKSKIRKHWGNITVKQYKGIDYQGTYELKFLEYVDKLGKLSLIERGPVICYTFDNVKHNYFSDFLIKGTNIVFEVKSTYFWKKNELVNMEKKKQAETIYNYNLIIDNDFSKIEKFFI